MKKRILYATTNSAKVARMRDILQELPLEIFSLRDVHTTTQINEDGNTPEENARKKAKYHFENTGMPTIAVDSGLHIQRFPREKQPGLLVQRIYGVNRDVSDSEMLDYYIQELERVGGQSKGVWTTALALVISLDMIFCKTLASKTMFVSQMSSNVMSGEPLNSLQIDPVTKKYYSEMSAEERIKAQGERAIGAREFIKQYWEYL
jgi:8-oxo-dGTP diphosphatase